MGKALVINGTNFLENKLATVNIGDLVPCTGISLSQDTISFSTIGATQQLSATLTPENTTDTVAWVSSDTNVATVFNGLVTCVGVGAATITATCGEQTASCSVTASVTIDANATLSAQNGYSQVGAELANSKDYLGYTSSSKSRVYLDPTATPVRYKAMSGTNSSPWDALYPIMIPNNAKKIIVTAPSGLKNHVYVTLLDSTSQPTYNVSYKGAKGVTVSTDIKSTMEFDLTQHSGYDSFAITLQTTGADASTITGDVTITFSAT